MTICAPNTESKVASHGAAHEEYKEKKIESLDETIADSFPCPEGDIFTLPTKEELVTAFNDLAALPGKMVGKIQEMKAEKEREIAALYKKLENAETQEARDAINKEIAEKEDFIKTQIQGVLQKEIDDVVETVEEFVEVLSGILSPYWDTEGQNRDWQKEARDAFEELIQEFHLYIPTKIAELISSIVPITFAINVFGLEIDVLKLVTDPNYQKELQDQIAGKNFVTQIVAKQKRLEEINIELTLGLVPDGVWTLEELEALEEEKLKLDEEIEALYKLKGDWVDTFFQLIPEEFRQFDGEFGVLDDKAKAKLTWKYIKTEIKEWLQNWYLKAIEKLLSLFDLIWDLLGLPDTPIQMLMDIMTFDLQGFIMNAIQYLKDAWKELKESFKTDIKKLEEKIEKVKEQLASDDISMEDHIRLSEELEALELEKRVKEEELITAAEAFHQGILKKLKSLNIFGFDIMKILGEIKNSTTASIEEEIMEISIALKDFKMNFHKKIMFEWIVIVKKFFSAIGLGFIFEPMMLTLCNFLKLIGMPMGIGLSIPPIAGVLSVITKETKNATVSQDKGNDDGIAFTKMKNEEQIDQTEFTVSTGSGTLHAFVSGVDSDLITDVNTTGHYSTEIEEGIFPNQMQKSGNTVTFNTAPLTQSEYDSGVTKGVALIFI